MFLNISFQYGQERIQNLVSEGEGYSYRGVLYSSSIAEFDLGRLDLLECIQNYIIEEKRSKINYSFIDKNNKGSFITAHEAYAQYERTGENPLTRWQTHLFEAVE